MLTAAKLVAAVCFAVFGVLVALLVKPVMPEGTQFGFFVEICGFLGLLNGWLVMGRLAGKGYRESMGAGFRTAITIVVWGLILFSIYEMIIRSTKLRYDGPMEAVIAAVGLVLDYGKLIITPEIIGAVLIGGFICGAMTEWTAKRWK